MGYFPEISLHTPHYNYGRASVFFYSVYCWHPQLFVVALSMFCCILSVFTRHRGGFVKRGFVEVLGEVVFWLFFFSFMGGVTFSWQAT